MVADTPSIGTHQDSFTTASNALAVQTCTERALGRTALVARLREVVLGSFAAGLSFGLFVVSTVRGEAAIAVFALFVVVALFALVSMWATDA